MVLNNQVFTQNIIENIKSCLTKLNLFQAGIAKTEFIENAKVIISEADKLIQLVRTRVSILTDELSSQRMEEIVNEFEIGIKDIIKKISSSYQNNDLKNEVKKKKKINFPLLLFFYYILFCFFQLFEFINLFYFNLFFFCVFFF